MSEAQESAVARSYTRARRHPWVQGKLGEWTLPLGPYTPAQLVVAGVGTVMLVETYGLWEPVLGPLPVVVLGVAVWAVRTARIGGRTPAAAMWGLATALAQPRAGRIGGRTARDRPAVAVLGGWYLTDTRADVALPARAVSPASERPRESSGQTGGGPTRAVPPGAGQVPLPGGETVLQRLLAASAVQ